MAWNNGFEEGQVLGDYFLTIGDWRGVAGVQVNAFRLFRFDQRFEAWKTHQSLSPLQIAFLKKEGSLAE